MRFCIFKPSELVCYLCQCSFRRLLIFFTFLFLLLCILSFLHCLPISWSRLIRCQLTFVLLLFSCFVLCIYFCDVCMLHRLSDYMMLLWHFREHFLYFCLLLLTFTSILLCVFIYSHQCAYPVHFCLFSLYRFVI